MKTLGSIHAWWGAIGLAVFALTGYYMAYIIGPMEDFPDGQRMLIRSAHIYLFFASATNIFYGSHLRPQSSQILQAIESLVIGLAPVLILIGFFSAQSDVNDVRILITLSLYALFGVAAFVFLRIEIYPIICRKFGKQTPKN